MRLVPGKIWHAFVILYKETNNKLVALIVEGAASPSSDESTPLGVGGSNIFLFSV